MKICLKFVLTTDKKLAQTNLDWDFDTTQNLGQILKVKFKTNANNFLNIDNRPPNCIANRKLGQTDQIWMLYLTFDPRIKVNRVKFTKYADNSLNIEEVMNWLDLGRSGLLREWEQERWYYLTHLSHIIDRLLCILLWFYELN